MSQPTVLRLLGFALICLGPRLPGIAANVVVHDDYFFAPAFENLLIRPAPGLLVPDFRIVTGVLMWLWTASWPEVFWLGALPKVAAGLFGIGFAESAYRCLRSLGWNHFSAFLAPALFISNVAVNEILLWNTTHVFPLWIWLVLLGFRLTDPEEPAVARRLLGGLALVTVLFAYEIYLVGFLVWALLEGCTRAIDGRPGAWTKVKSRGMVFATLAAFYVGVVLALTRLGAGGRSFAAPSSFEAFVDAKVHGTANLIGNIWMPTLAFWTSVETAWSAWKWALVGSIIMAVIVGVVGARPLKTATLLAGFMIVGPGLAVMPTWVSRQSPESWRVSLPALLATCLGLGLVTEAAWRAARIGGVFRRAVATGSVGVMLVCLALSLPAAAYEAQLRVAANELDRKALEQIRWYWSGKGMGSEGYSVGRISMKTRDDVWRPSGRQLTVAYAPYRIQSAFRWEYSWRGRVGLSGMDVVELEDGRAVGFEGVLKRECVRRPETCRFDLGIALAKRMDTSAALEEPAGPLVIVHDDVNRVSAIGVPLVP